MKVERLCLVVNPRSAAGATRQRMGALRRAADRHFQSWDLWTTEGPGHATELAARAVAEGFDVVVAVGGDGTANEVVNGLFVGDRVRSAAVSFSVVPAGTGSDLVKTLGIPADPDAALGVIARSPGRATDVASVRLMGHTGEEVSRIGINVTGLGMNGDVVRRANAGSKRFGGRATFAWATVRTLATYRAAPVGLRWTASSGREASWEGRLWSAFVGNGQFCGGGMRVGRGGSMDDGLLDLTVIPELPLRRALRGLPRLLGGTLELVKDVSTAAVVHLEASPLTATPVLVDIDGEQPGLLPAAIRALPKAMLVRGLWPYASK